MRSPSRLIVTRRQALQGGSIAALFLSTGLEWSQPLTAQAATAPADKEAVTVAGSVVATCFATDWATRFDVSFPVAVELSAPAMKATTLTVEWDDRLFKVAPTVAVLRDGSIDSLDATPTAGRMELVIPSGATGILMRPEVLAIYPGENIGTPVPSSITVGSTAAVRTPVDAMLAAPWGLELRVEWNQSQGYSFPTQIQAASIGPHPVPAGVSVVARTYGDVKPLVSQLEGKASSKRPHAHSTVIDRAFVLEAPLNQGDTVNVSLLPENPEKANTRVSISQVGQVFVTFPDSSSADARKTGKYSVAAVTSSGTELTDSSTSRRA